MAAHRTRLCASVTLFIRIFGVIVWRPEYLTSPAQAVKEYCQRNPVFLFTAGRSEPVWVVAIQNTSPLSQVFVSPGPRERALSEAGFRAISPAFEQPVLASDRRSQQRLECANLLALLLAARANLQRVGLRSRKTAATSRRIPNAGATAKQPRCPDARSVRGAKPGTSEIWSRLFQP